MEILKRDSKIKDRFIWELNWKTLKFENEKLEILDDIAKLAKLYELGMIDGSRDPIYIDPTYENNFTIKEELTRF